MMERAAVVVSYVFHPLWMPLITLAGVYFLDPFLGLHPTVFRLLLLVLTVNLLAPGISILMMRYRNIISNLDITRRQERFLPFALFLFYYGLSYFWLRSNASELYIPVVVFSIFTAMLASLSLAMLITLKTKISMHLLAVGGVCGVVAAVNRLHLLGAGDVLGACVIAAGLVGWARITLGVHTHGQVYGGFLLGFAVHYLFLQFEVYL